MQAQKASTNCLKMPLIFDMMYHLLPFSMIKDMLCKRRLTPFISYTNLGIIDDKRLCFGSHIIEKVFIPTSIKNNPYFQLSVSTFKGCCTLSSCLFASEEDVTFATGILNNVKSEMENLVK